VPVLAKLLLFKINESFPSENVYSSISKGIFTSVWLFVSIFPTHKAFFSRKTLVLSADQGQDPRGCAGSGGRGLGGGAACRLQDEVGLFLDSFER